TSAWKVESVTSLMMPAISVLLRGPPPSTLQNIVPGRRQRAGRYMSYPIRASRRSIAPAQHRHEPRRLERDAHRHLRVPVPAVAKDDRHLAHGEPRAQRPVRELDLEGVAVRADRR